MFTNFTLNIFFKPFYCGEKSIRKLEKKIIKYTNGINYTIFTTIQDCITLVNSFEKSFSVDLDNKATVVKFGDYFFKEMNNFLLVFGDEKYGIDPTINSLTTDSIMLDTRNSINLVCAITVFLYEFLIS